ncbi:MAG: hypothetical protein ACXV5J_05180 [Candidatus Angelobacter sp.]
MPEYYAIVVDVPDPTLKCFIAFPFSENDINKQHPITDVIDHAIRGQHLEPHWIEREAAGTAIVSTIASAIRGASMLVAVCTPEETTAKTNVNVMYELGLADALGKPTLVMTTELKSLPFDIAGKQAFEYSNDELANRKSSVDLQRRLELAIAELKRRVKRTPPLVRDDMDDVWVVGAANRLALTDFFWAYARTVFEFADMLGNQGVAVTGQMNDLFEFASQLVHANSSFERFMHTWKDFRTAHERRVVPYLDAAACSPVDGSLRSLQGSVPEAQEIISALAQDYQQLKETIAEYARTFEDAKACVNAVMDGQEQPSGLLRKIGPLAENLSKLTMSADTLIKNLAREINGWFFRPAAQERPALGPRAVGAAR